MKGPALTTIVIIFFLTSCGNTNGKPSEVLSSSLIMDSLKIQILRSFVNIDYQKVDPGTDTAMHSGFFSEIPVTTDPILCYVATPDCSFCIATVLDFMRTVCLSDTKSMIPIIVFKDGDSDLFQFYKEQYISHLDSSLHQTFKSIPALNLYNEYVNNTKDGAYLIYNGRILNYMSRSPQLNTFRID